ncbi:GL15355 [Drosophila persimilis]|uniref:GL15355 n=1 Tax=Drosophila persimilis TaxID=7234 RepID=B4GPR1_DROPE|nr:GL15355 [Drosophila persimilis]
MDEGPNADIIYSITGGNLGNKFSIDARSGELSCRPLDREQHARYTLQVQASDRGQPTSRQGHCNITVLVEDQNDNAPRFDLPKYVASVAEDAPLGASVVRIKATDADLGVNARLVYSLANETQWQFAIDSKSGLITTVGKLDRELQSSYSFMVLATDGGRYEVRSARVAVQINVLDVNDNRPVFERYPYIGQVPALIQPGQTLLKVQAHDADQGLNGELLYSLKGDAGKFRINPNTGALSATQSLASESGRLLQLEVVARDKGNPPQSSVGLIELLVGEAPQGAPVLRFQNETYRVKLRENSPAGLRLLQVVAVRSDGRRQKVQFSFGAGNDEGIFSLDPSSGEIRVANPSLLDYDRFATPTLAALSRGRAMHYEEVTEDPSVAEEDRNGTRSQRALSSTSFALASTQPNELRLVLVARSSDGPILSSYAELVVELQDENDTVRSSRSGSSSRPFDSGRRGNSPSAGTTSSTETTTMPWSSNPPFSGIVKTNIVLDREIREVYNLKIIATDEGVPQMTGTSTVRVQIVDVNDNQPTFPPNNLVSVSEATELGAVIASISANDVDTYPTLTYRLVSESSVDDESLTLFALDRYSGKLVLKRRLDYELQQEYQLEVIASDAAHEARTTLTVRVNDENDNAPVFLAQQPPAYFAILPAVAEVADSLSMDLELLSVNATDADAEGSNSKIRYSIDPPVEGFSVGASSGVVSVNMSRLQIPESASGDYFVRILARDGGKHSLFGATLLRVQASDSGSARSQFQQTQYRAQISEAAPLGSVVLQLSQDVQDQPFVIAAGNEEAAFELLQSKAIVLVKPLDRERNDLYKLRLLINRGGSGSASSPSNSSAGITVVITVLDANDNFPIFDRSAKYEAEISELAPLRYSIAQLVALDADQENSPNSEVVYDITSGNDEHMFTIDLVSGVLFVNNRLDYDSGATSYELIIRACDSHHPRPLCSLQPFHLELHDENDNEPKFPLSEYVHFIAENEPVGSSVFQAHASDLDRGPFGALNYSLAPASGDDSSWKLFRVDSHSGMVSSAAVFDFEQRQRYDMELRASDMGGKGARVAVRVEVDSRDEFAPQFSERTYRFVLPAAAALPQGFVVGQVTATDADSGPDGRVVYQLSAPHTHFKVNRSSGAVLIKRKLKLDDDSLGSHDGRDISLVISASSGRQNSLTAMAVVEIALDPLAHPGTNLASAGINGGGGTMGDWAIGLLIAFLLVLCAAAGIFLFIHMRSRKPRNVVKPHLSTETVGVGNSNSYVDPSAFDTIPIRGGISGGAAGGASGQFAPPKYDEIPPFGPHAGSSGAATTSELSGSEQSGSSGRGSAEDDGEDEEIRMINEGPLHHRGGGGAGGSDDGRISDISVQNTQEYLARLGIVDHDPSGSGGGGGASSMAGSSHPIPMPMTMPMTMPMVDSLHMFHDEDAATARSDITNLIYAKLNDVAGGNGGGSERGSSADDAATTAGSIGTIGTAITGHGHGAAMMGSYGEVPVPVPVVVGGSNVGGSLSSIVHSEEELTGSYNWDYLLDWGPQYQPLAHVFSEIARLKDDTMSEHSGHSGSGASSSAKSKHSSSHSSAGAGSVVLKPPPPPTHIPPPLLTNVAPRAINLPMRLPPHLSMAGGLPRSPIGHEASGSFSTSSAMSPSFSPSLSPLATRSPSISPLGGGPPTHLPHVSLPRHGHAPPPQPTQRGNVGTRM